MTVPYKKLRFFIFLPLLLATGLSLVASAPSADAACAANNANLGTVTGTFTVPTTGTYRVWSRMQPDSTNAANNSYTLEVDSGTVAAGSATCNITVGDATIPASTWTWVDYQGGNTASKINMTLSAGTHTYTMYGREDGVELDRVVFSADLNCIPSGNGDNCASSTTADTTNPTSTIQAPVAGATLSGTNATVSAIAQDNVLVTKVEFYIDGQIIGSATTSTGSSYSITLNTTSYTNGTHILTARAYDAANNQGNSPAVSITINNIVVDTIPPTVSITGLAANATISTNTTINATAADAGGISKVEFYIDGSTLLGTDITPPYSFTINPTLFNNGSHSLTAKAYDSANNSTVSAAIAVTIANPDVTPPSVIITAPFNNTTVTGTTIISATATDTGSGVARVEFSVDGALKTTDTSSPYTYSLNSTTLTNAVHTISVKAFDVSGNASTPATVSLTVNNTVALQSCDINKSGTVDTNDLFILLANFGKTVPTGTNGDCNKTGSVDINDLFILLAQFGK